MSGLTFDSVYSLFWFWDFVSILTVNSDCCFILLFVDLLL
ncbi:hypothetical protein LINPERHAP2_LOCUS309, partial [Linum perenne]